jgi:hypothetical protein
LVSEAISANPVRVTLEKGRHWQGKLIGCAVVDQAWL